MRRSAINVSGAMGVVPPLCVSCRAGVTPGQSSNNLTTGTPPPPKASRPVSNAATRTPARIVNEASSASDDAEPAEAVAEKAPSPRNSGLLRLIWAVIVAGALWVMFSDNDNSGTGSPQPVGDTSELPPPVAVPLPADVRPARPANSPGSWVSTSDYPDNAIRQKQEGTTVFQLDVTREGRVSGCSIRKSSGHDDLDQAACRALTKRARFTPGVDETGEPVPSTYSNSIRWVLPR